MFPLLCIHLQIICVVHYATHVATLSFALSFGFRLGEILILVDSSTNHFTPNAW
jgi:hypothetical protein